MKTIKIMLVESAGKVNLFIQCPACDQLVMYPVYHYPFSLDYTEKVIVEKCAYEMVGSQKTIASWVKKQHQKWLDHHNEKLKFEL